MHDVVIHCYKHLVCHWHSGRGSQILDLAGLEANYAVQILDFCIPLEESRFGSFCPTYIYFLALIPLYTCITSFIEYCSQQLSATANSALPSFPA